MAVFFTSIAISCNYLHSLLVLQKITTFRGVQKKYTGTTLLCSTGLYHQHEKSTYFIAHGKYTAKLFIHFYPSYVMVRRYTLGRYCLSLQVLMVTAGILIRPVVGQVTCPNGENYQPCTCSNFNGEFSVVCKEVSLKDVVNVFNRTTPSNLRTFTCFLSPSDASNDSIITIPTDLLKEHQVVYEIQIYSLQSQIYSLRIEPEAFRSSKNYTEGFYLGNYMDSGRLDLSRLDFDFLMGFHKLSTLDLRFTANVHLAKWTSLPPLPNLKSLSIFISTGLSEWDTFPSLVRGLEELYLHYNNIESVAMDRILNWTVGHSATTLENLGLSGNDLTSIPQQISSLISLRSFVIESQNTGIPLISSGSIKSYGSLTFFSAHSNGFETIESDAFQGWYI